MPEEKKASNPRRAGTMAAPAENKPGDVNQQRMNGPVRELEFGKGLLSRRVLVAGKRQG